MLLTLIRNVRKPVRYKKQKRRQASKSKNRVRNWRKAPASRLIIRNSGTFSVTSRKGAAGYVHLSKVPCWPIDTTYLNLNSLDKSTAIPGLNRNDAYALKLPLTPLPEQCH